MNPWIARITEKITFICDWVATNSDNLDHFCALAQRHKLGSIDGRGNLVDATNTNSLSQS
jgi:hypothetical protein